MTARTQRLAARRFIEANHISLASNIIAWRKNGALPHDCKLHDLAALCVPLAAPDDEYQEAERQVVSFLLECAASATPHRSAKLPAGRQNILSSTATDLAAGQVRKRWPEAQELRYLGTDPKTFAHYFQEIGNPLLYIL